MKKSSRKKTVDFRIRKMPKQAHKKVLYHQKNRMIGSVIIDDAGIDLILKGAAAYEKEEQEKKTNVSVG